VQRVYYLGRTANAENGSAHSNSAGLAAEKQKRLDDIQEQRTALETKLTQSQQTAAQAEGRERAAYSALKGQEAANAAQMEARGMGQAQRLGGMSDLDVLMGRQAFEFVKANRDNLGMLPQDVLARANQYAPEEMDKLREDRGKAMAARERAYAPDSYDRDLDADRKRADELRREKRGVDEVNAGKIADVLADAILKVMERAAKRIETNGIDDRNRGIVNDAQRAATVNMPKAG
jgi:hypothetical protein